MVNIVKFERHLFTRFKWALAPEVRRRKRRTEEEEEAGGTGLTWPLGPTFNFEIRPCGSTGRKKYEYNDAVECEFAHFVC